MNSITKLFFVSIKKRDTLKENSTFHIFANIFETIKDTEKNIKLNLTFNRID